MMDETLEDFIHFPGGYDREFYEQLCAERMELANQDRYMDRTTIPKYRWIANRNRNEVLDMLVYSLGMWYHLGCEDFLDKGLWEEFSQDQDVQFA